MLNWKLGSTMAPTSLDFETSLFPQPKRDSRTIRLCGKPCECLSHPCLTQGTSISFRITLNVFLGNWLSRCDQFKECHQMAHTREVHFLQQYHISVFNVCTRQTQKSQCLQIAFNRKRDKAREKGSNVANG